MFKSMNYVYEVYKEGGFKNAADKLIISPSSLSASVKRVEEKVGYPIFDRSIRPLRLTECGEHYIKAVEEIMDIQEHFEAYVNDLGDLRSGALRLGGTSVASSILLPSIISEYHQRFPNIIVEFAEGTSLDMAKMLIDGEYDMIMDYGVDDAELVEFRHIQDDYLILTVPAAYQINSRLSGYQITYDDIREGHFKDSSVRTVPLDEFRDQPFVLIKPKNNSRYHAEQFFDRYSIHPRITFEASQQMTAYFTMAAGIGCSFISSTLLKGMSDNPSCVYYKLDTDIALRHLGLYWKQGRYVTKAMEEFIRLSEEICKKNEI